MDKGFSGFLLSFSWFFSFFLLAMECEEKRINRADGVFIGFVFGNEWLDFCNAC